MQVDVLIKFNSGLEYLEWEKMTTKDDPQFKKPWSRKHELMLNAMEILYNTQKKMRETYAGMDTSRGLVKNPYQDERDT